MKVFLTGNRGKIGKALEADLHAAFQNGQPEGSIGIGM
jgi:hypothetical protein